MTAQLQMRALALLLLGAAANAQRPGNGISKQTYAATDPQRSFTWLAKYLPIHCGDPLSMCNSTSACGQKGRANLCPNAACRGSGFSSFMFHQVNTSARPSGPVSVAAVERTFDARLTAAFAAQRYDPFLDHAVVFWTSDLPRYLAAFDADGVPYLPLAWADDAGGARRSVIFQSPGTQVVVELVGDASSGSSSSSSSSSTAWVHDPNVRAMAQHFLNVGADKATDASILVPLLISKASSNLSAVADFYVHALNAKVTGRFNGSGAAGAADVLFFNPGFAKMEGKMSVRFVWRAPDAAADALPGSMSVAALEAAKFAGHDVVHDNKGNNTANIICGFDKWYDNHYGIDGGSTTLTEYKANFDARGWPYYHAWGSGQGPENVYAVDPTGDAIQLDAAWTNGAPPGVAGDALGDMCTQGDCKAGYRPTPPACAAALSAACPGLALGKSPCADCVYARWTALKLASCLNADAEAYCVTDA